MNEERKLHLVKLLSIHTKRAQLLEEQVALFGVATPPHISIELDEITQKITDIQKEIADDKLVHNSLDDSDGGILLVPPSRNHIFEQMNSSFSFEEIFQISFELGIDHELFPNSAKSEFLRELILHCERTEKINDLMVVCRKKRPNQFK